MYGEGAYGEGAYGANDGGQAADVDMLPAQGFRPTVFGVAARSLVAVARGARAAQFGTPSTPSDVLTQAAGFATASFGLPFHFVSGGASISTAPGRATPLPGPTFGRPLLSIRQTASGFSATTWGLAKAATSYRATGDREGAWGQPKAALYFRTSSFTPVKFGTTGSVPTFQASGQWRRPTRWGRPRSAISFAAVPAITTSWASTAWGTPATSAVRHRATPVPARHRFGRPTLRRTEPC